MVLCDIKPLLPLAYAEGCSAEAEECSTRILLCFDEAALLVDKFSGLYSLHSQSWLEARSALCALGENHRCSGVSGKKQLSCILHRDDSLYGKRCWREGISTSRVRNESRRDCSQPDCSMCLTWWRFSRTIGAFQAGSSRLTPSSRLLQIFGAGLSSLLNGILVRLYVVGQERKNAAISMSPLWIW